MNELTVLLTQHSVEELILLILAVLFAFKGLTELFNYFYSKIKSHFGIQNNKEQWEQKITKSLQDIQEEIQTLKDQNSQTHRRQEDTDLSVTLIQERLQENSRSYLIDTHHKFCYEVKAIDDLNLQSMERRYLYYKTAGGDSFVDNLMDEVRALPKINFYTGVLDSDHDGTDDRKE